MIVVENVLPAASELRPCSPAWESTRKLAWVQTLALLATFVASFIVAAIYVNEAAAAWVGATLVTVLFVLIVSGRIVTSIGAQIAERAAATQGPARWTFDEENVRIESALSTTTFRWEMVKAVTEEPDRVIFSLTPTSSGILPLRSLTDAQAKALRNLVDDAKASGRLGRGVD